MKIIITGASGYIGRQIVPLFLDNNHQLLLIGRDTTRLNELFPGIEATSYAKLDALEGNYDAFVHLAVMNNDQIGSLQDFRDANVNLLDQIVSVAKHANVSTIINLTTLHVTSDANGSYYAQTKAEAEELLSKQKEFNIVNIRLPAVYGATYKGKLAILNKVPNFMRDFCLQFLGALKPTVHINKVYSAIIENLSSDTSNEAIVTDGQSENRVYHFFNRTMDIGFCLCTILFLSWLLVIVWIAIKINSDGPSFFRQERVGKHGNAFTCWKFRTMRVNTPQAGTHEIGQSAITPIGAFLRRTKVDELPQIWNILKNELSLVGPRPCLPVQKELVAERQKLGVLDIKGGITGLAQIRGIDMSNPVKLAKIDHEYVQLRTVLLDLKIIIATATGKGRGDNVKEK